MLRFTPTDLPASITPMAVPNAPKLITSFIFDCEFPLSDSPQPISSLTLVEFKRPMRDDYTDEENPLKQIVKTIQAIREGKYMATHH